jgi:hypothetical protein
VRASGERQGVRACPQRPSPGDRNAVWRDRVANNLYLLTYPARERDDDEEWLLFANPELHDQVVFAANNVRYELEATLFVQLVWMIRHPLAPIIDDEREVTSPESWGDSVARYR